MKPIFGKSKWEMWDDPLEVFLQRVTASGFEATEIYLGSLQESPVEIVRLHAAYGLRLIGQILTQGQTYKRSGNELDKGKKIPAISNFVESELERWEHSDIPKSTVPSQGNKLDEFFRANIREVWES